MRADPPGSGGLVEYGSVAKRQPVGMRAQVPVPVEQTVGTHPEAVNFAERLWSKSREPR